MWRASAPGGLIKAIKIVYGRSDQTHAASELRALEKIKAVRHPFLLSLERFEVIDSRLLVVMELADGSLRDHYRHCRDNGKPGIDRQELLNYLRDAADALDYLAQKHDLQHLDIKPENLLLVGGHVKIADFGLVKDLHAAQASIVGGMTPTYAAPELFQGRPSPHSDQYSLAIIYQELLTGTLPFEGSSAADLTLKHINELPSLDPLCEGDRFVISQALAKDPHHRFGSCREMVEALIRSSTDDQQPAAMANPTQLARQTDSTQRRHRMTLAGNLHSPDATLLFDENESNWAKESAPVMIDLPQIAPLQVTPGPVYQAKPWSAPPTLVIGIGGSGLPVLQSLRQSNAAASDNNCQRDNLAMLLIDSTPQATSQAINAADHEVSLLANEVVCCPLRKPQDYREKSDRLLKWMSRRWLYNIPRSLRTEAIRPLGRLVFVDHARLVMQRLRTLVRQVMDAAKTQGNTQPLRIYFVGSISGGTASGMLHDLGYATRAMLEHLEIPSAELIAITTHSPSRRSEMMELSRVNSFAWLTELAHWSRPGSRYPGDETAGIPAAEPNIGPFDHVYVLDLGDRVDNRQFSQAAQDIADYILLDAMSPAGDWIAACRARDNDARGKNGGLSLRTFAVRRSAEVDQQMTRSFAEQLLVYWGADESSTTSPTLPRAAAPLSETTSSIDAFVTLARRIVDEQLGGNAVAYLGKQMLAAGITPATLTLANALPLIDQLVPGSTPCPEATVLNGKSLLELGSRVESELAAQASQWLTRLVASPWGHPSHVLQQADNLSKRLATVGDELQRQVESAGQVVQSLPLTATPSRQIDQIVVDHWRQRLQLVVSRLALQLCEAQSKCVEIIAQDVDCLVQYCRHHAIDTGTIGTKNPPRQLLRAVDESVRAQLAEQGGYHGLWNLAGKGAHLVDRVARFLPAALRSVALAADEEPGAPGPGDPWQFRSLGPTLRFQGGECSHLIVGPDPAPGGAATPGVAHVHLPQLTRTYTLFEAGGLSPLHVAATFVSGRRDYADMADRVHTRRDVNWIPLLRVDHEAEPPASLIPDMVYHTQALGSEALANTAVVPASPSL